MEMFTGIQSYFSLQLKTNSEFLFAICSKHADYGSEEALLSQLPWDRLLHSECHITLHSDKCDVSHRNWPGRPTPIILVLWSKRKEMLRPAWAI